MQDEEASQHGLTNTEDTVEIAVGETRDYNFPVRPFTRGEVRITQQDGHVHSFPPSQK